MSIITQISIENFIKKFGTKVNDNEPSDYVELMMDDHKCITHNNNQYYIYENEMFSNTEQEVFDYLIK